MKLTAFFIFIFLCCTNAYAQEIELEDRALKVKSFPCMDCHKGINSIEPKFPLVRPHEDMTFKHMGSIKNCFQCHDFKDRNKLVLQTGERIGFNQSHRQCFQCHGGKKKDWELGMHGKTVGSWNGDKYKYTCANCHNPHHPKFRIMKADKGPVHPNPKGPSKGGH